MKIRKWIAAVLATSLILIQFALGEGVKDRAEVFPGNSDLSEEADLPEIVEEGRAEITDHLIEPAEESMIFVFETREIEAGPQSEERPELTDEMSEDPELEAETEEKVPEKPETEMEVGKKCEEILENDIKAETNEKESQKIDAEVDEGGIENPDADQDTQIEIPEADAANELLGASVIDTEENVEIQDVPEIIPDNEDDVIPEASEIAAEADIMGQEPEDVPGENLATQTGLESYVPDESLMVLEEPGTEILDDETDEDSTAQNESKVKGMEEAPVISEEPKTEAETDAFIDTSEREPEIQTDPETHDYTQEADSVLTGNAKADSAGGESESTGSVAVISGLEVTPVETNNKYRQMTFSFTAERREYTCLVTGLAEIGTNSESAWQLLAEDIVANFLAGKVFTLSEADAAVQYDLELDLIDAEKINKSGGSDSNICWAASTADMLEYAGWNKAADEDATFQEFREEFNNRGGYQSMGISWYLNGINPYQASYRSGSIAYGEDYKEEPDGAAQQQHKGSGGYWKEYAASDVMAEYDEQVPKQLEAAVDQLAEGYGVGVGSYFYRDQETIAAGHALTIFGYIREKLEEAAAAIRALFISDSDDQANGSQTDPTKYPDEYVMYHTEPFENSTISSVQLKNYNPSYTTVIGIVSTLAPRQTAQAETEGTGNAVQNANLTPTGLRIEDADRISLTEAEPGTIITIGTEFKNQSYKSLPKNAEIRYMLKIYRNGQLVSEVENTVRTDSNDGLRPNNSLESSLQVTLDQGGEYTFETQVTEITTADGIAIPEAYVSDNLYRGTTRVKITGETEEDPEKKEPSEPDAPEEAAEQLLNLPETVYEANTGDGGKPEETGEMIYTLIVALATDTEYVLDFDAAAATSDSFIRLRNRKTGETVNPESYRILLGEKSGYRIAFEEEFIRSLKPGKNDFVLTWESGRVLIRIMIM